MSTTPRLPVSGPGLLRLAIPLIAIAFVTACVGESPTIPDAQDGATAQLMKGGNGGKPGTDPGPEPGPVEETPLTMTFSDRSGDMIRSDGLGAYVHDECGVSAVFNSTSDDALLDPDASRIKRKDAAACGTDARRLEFDLGSTVVQGGFMNADKVRLVEGIGELRRVQFNIEPCNRLVFDPSEFAGTDYAVVDRIDASTWLVHAEAGSATGRCVDTGGDLELPFEVTIQLAS